MACELERGHGQGRSAVVSSSASVSKLAGGRCQAKAKAAARPGRCRAIRRVAKLSVKKDYKTKGSKADVKKAFGSMSEEVLPRFAFVNDGVVTPIPVKLEQVPPLTAGA